MNAKNTIHHNTLKKAERIDVELRDISNDEWGRRFSAKWKNVVFIALDVQEALAAAMLARMLKIEYNIDFVQRVVKKNPVGYEAVGIAKYNELPSLSDVVDRLVDASAVAMVSAAPESAPDTKKTPPRKKAVVEERDGDEEEESEDGEIEAEDGEEEESGYAGIVNPVYREVYASRGNPHHCGDWLALALEGQFTDSAGKLDRNLFLEFLELNGVNTGKTWATATNHGWQGRMRMTARNLLEVILAKSGMLIMSSRDKRKVPDDFLAALRAKHQNRLDD